MRRLMAMDRMASVSRTAIRGERGAVSTIVATLLGGGVILGFTALSVDVGSLMFERRQLQAGADAAALSLAKTCASAADAAALAAECSASNAATMNILRDLNNLNNYRDDTGGFQSQPLDGSGKGYPQGVCGSGAATAGLPPCPTPGGGLSECPPIPDYITANGVPYVEAHTQSKESNGTSLLPTSFIKTLVGGSTGNTVAACSRAAYGAPGTGIGALPITVSGCDWMHATNGNAGGGGGQYWASPKYLAGGNANGYGGVGQPPGRRLRRHRQLRTPVARSSCWSRTPWWPNRADPVPRPRTVLHRMAGTCPSWRLRNSRDGVRRPVQDPGVPAALDAHQSG